VQDAIDIAHGVSDGGRVEEVELLVSGSRELIARGRREGPQRAAEHPGSSGHQQSHR
jgi:hypothetical protein